VRLRRIPEARPLIAAHPLVYDLERVLAAGGGGQLFVEQQSLTLEIGMGRGRFITSLAAARPEENFLGLELREEVIMQALTRLKGQEPANLRFLWLNADHLAELFLQGKVQRIYLNFPDPWPKNRHAKRRLTADSFLGIYRRILAADGDLIFKTDNEALFSWSLDNFIKNGWQAVEISHDSPPNKSGMMSEYERRYRRAGRPICYACFLLERPIPL